MDKRRSNLAFQFMSFGFKWRDIFFPRMRILKDVGIEKGSHVLDYGCGPGGYILPALELAGRSGRVFALDIHPLALKKIQNMVSKKRITNVETILSDCKTGLPDESLDVVLLYDVYHIFTDPLGILTELHRVLKPQGILSFSDHHMKENEIRSQVTRNALFELSKKNQKTFEFSRRST